MDAQRVGSSGHRDRLKKIAVIMAQHWLGRMGIERSFEGRPNTGEHLLSGKFDSVADALLWVTEP
jgi:hypothetical protein